MAERVECDVCKLSFKDSDGLEQHMQAKHQRNTEKKESGKSSKFWIYLIGAIVLLLVLYLAFGSSSTGEYDSFATCLAESGFTMYGAYWCPHCQDQKELFGKSADKIPYVECSLPNRAGQTEACIEAGIESYPTWELPDGRRVSGVLSLQELSGTSGCSLP